jgi:hypothetical protein
MTGAKAAGSSAAAPFVGCCAIDREIGSLRRAVIASLYAHSCHPALRRPSLKISACAGSRNGYVAATCVAEKSDKDCGETTQATSFGETGCSRYFATESKTAGDPGISSPNGGFRAGFR